MKKCTLLSFIISSLLFQSCATILSGTRDMVNFKSNPPGATIYMNGREIGSTNNSIEIKRKSRNENALITYRKDGYEDTNFEFRIKVVGAYWLNILCFPLIGTVVDLTTGAPYKSKYTEYEKTLIPKSNTQK